MKLKDLDEYDSRQEYKGSCSRCGHEYIIRAQQDDGPEYYTDIYLNCDWCRDEDNHKDEYVHFRIPVN